MLDHHPVSPADKPFDRLELLAPSLVMVTTLIDIPISVAVVQDDGGRELSRHGTVTGGVSSFYPFGDSGVGMEIRAENPDHLTWADPFARFVVRVVTRELILLEQVGDLEDRLRLLTRIANVIRGVDDLETGYQVALQEIAEAINADQAFIQTETGLGNRITVTCNMIPEEIDTCISAAGPVLSRGDGCSLLVSPVAGKTNGKRNGNAVFIRQPGRPPFDADDGRLVGLLESIVSPAFGFLRFYTNQKDLYRCTVQSLAAAIDAKDRYTLGHSQRVARYAVAIGQRLGLDECDLHDLEIAAIMHDLGKIGVPETILTKPTGLTAAEMDIIRRHPELTNRILEPSKMSDHIVIGAGEHHERLDGSGYPHGLSGGRISLFGRIIAVADVFDAITTDRPYRPAMNIQDAVKLMCAGIDDHFERRIVMALLGYLLTYQLFDVPLAAQTKFSKKDRQQRRAAVAAALNPNGTPG